MSRNEVHDGAGTLSPSPTRSAAPRFSRAARLGHGIAAPVYAKAEFRSAWAGKRQGQGRAGDDRGGRAGQAPSVPAAAIVEATVGQHRDAA